MKILILLSTVFALSKLHKAVASTGKLLIKLMVSNSTQFWNCAKLFYTVFIIADLIIGPIDSTSASCPTSCKCKSGKYDLDMNGNCNYWCSKSGYCGDTNTHKQGVDCRSCKGNTRL